MRYLILSCVSLICLNGYFFADPTAGEARENTRIMNNWIKENQKITEFTKRYKESGDKINAFNVYRVKPIEVNPSALKNCEELQKILKSGKTEIHSIDIDGIVLLAIKKQGYYEPYNLFLASSTGYKKAINEAVCGFSVYNLGKDTPLFLDLTGCGGSGFAVDLYTLEGGVLKTVLGIGGWQPTEYYVDIDNDGVSEIVNSHRVSNVDLIQEKLTNFNPPLVLVQEDFYKFQNGTFENVGITFRANNSDLNEETKIIPEGKNECTEENGINIEKDYYLNGVLKNVRRLKKYPDIKYHLVSEGLQETFYYSGKPKTKRGFKKYIPDGIWEEFYENGNLIYREEYDNGKNKGVWKFYKEDGTLTAEENYSDPGKKVIKTKYYDNGKIKYTSVYTPDSDTWNITDFETDGKIKKTTIIEAGKIK